MSAPNSLCHLFNVGLFDFARQLPDGSWEGCEWPTNATHQLFATSWNYDHLYKPNKNGKIQKPKGYALSVCALPLTRKRRLRGPLIKARHPLPPAKERLVYNASGELEGKRRVVQWMVEVMEAKVKKRFLAKASTKQLDTLYRNLLVASASLRR